MKTAPTRVPLRFCAACVLLLGLSACDEMRNQGRYKPYEPTPFFSDSMSARQLPAGTIARGTLGTIPMGDLDKITEFPMKITREVLENGRTRYNIFCAPCHGIDGYGRGMIVQRGFLPPPSFHEERLRGASVGHYFNAITNGYGAMFPYASRIPVEDRWAIIAYIRALQLSQHAKLEQVPADQRQKLEEPRQ